MKQLYIGLVFLFISFGIQAQTATYSGIIKDRNTNLPVEYVSITGVNSNISTMTNADGRFRLTVPQEIKKIKFSHLNYDVLEYVLVPERKEMVVYLNSSAYEMEEMVILNRSLREVMNEIIKNSKSKFSKDIKLSTYYREMMNINNEVYSYADGMLDYFYKNKSTSNITVNESRAIKFQSKEFESYENNPVNFYLLNLQEIVTNAFQFERLSKIVKNKNYEMYLTLKKNAEGKELTTLYFEPSETAKDEIFEGTVVFDDEAKLILEINIQLSRKHLKNIKFEDRVLYRIKFSEIRYKQIFNAVDGKYFLVYDTRRVQAMVKVGERHQYLIGGIHELITVNSAVSSEKPKPDLIYYHPTLQPLGKNYTTKYWNDQNVILLNSKEEQALGKINN
ncbi:carboxypeptidase-like regulatory domain-containing protein [Myroides ceti]|uniref:Carboxypeptidase-like regulatory domain-containing protein n=1 Tax=Paenimyroides ceti TaxID=395087 RepID=A0ABT8CP29_9FLAO|nr:carboxypeptidase-like regulatory domain-containing protein [Paenimyroides ceti]MDN3706262.1 carboxypeptidase-like regulatory domain-containing protein [Paenimyroides ceti]